MDAKLIYCLVILIFLMYEAETETVHEDIYKDKELFDFDNYLKESKYYDGKNNFVIGKRLSYFHKFSRLS